MINVLQKHAGCQPTQDAAGLLSKDGTIIKARRSVKSSSMVAVEETKTISKVNLIVN